MTDSQLKTALLREQRFLHGIARDLVRDPHLAEDLVQQTNSSAIERGPSNLRLMRGWMRTVARRGASRMRRREELRRVSETRAARPESALGPGAAEIETSRAVLDALATIGTRYREVLVLRYWHGRTPTAIAESLNAPLNTIKSRIARGIEAMRSELDRRTNGDRDAWVATLLALPGPRPSATASIRRTLHRRAIDVAATATAIALLSVAHTRPEKQVPMIKLTAASVIVAPRVSIPAIPLRASHYAPALIRNTGAAGIASLDVNADQKRADQDRAGSGKS